MEKGIVFYGRSIGFNYIPAKECNNSKHAEVCLIERLPFRKKIKTIRIVSIRTNLKNEIGCAKPCQDCINFMTTKARLKGYNISRVYYSTNEKTFVCSKLSDLINDPDQHISKGQKTIMSKYKNI